MSQNNYYLATLGCQLNENDSEKISGMLEALGYNCTQDLNESDIIVYNTCCVRDNAEQKVFGHLGMLKHLKKKNPSLIIVLCGCMMQQDSAGYEIVKKYPHIDIIFGTHNLHKFPSYLKEHIDTRKRVIEIDHVEGTINEGLPVKREDNIKAWITVMYGCNNYCSYCIVPYVRGRERSRNKNDILKEIKELAAQNYKEITLLGQNVNSYGKDFSPETDFASLLYDVHEIEGIDRIRFATSHPKDLSTSLIDAIKNLNKVCNHIHLPIQSGSTKVLGDMNRKYTKEQYLNIIEKIKEEIPDAAITTDIIVGFPGETDDDFEETLDVIKRVRFDFAFTFIYSKRRGTPAADRNDHIDENTKKLRFDKLLSIQNAISLDKNTAYLGKEYEVLVEGSSKNRSDVLTGRTETNKIVNFEGGDITAGSLVKVRITEAKTWSLEGVLC